MFGAAVKFLVTVLQSLEIMFIIVENIKYFDIDILLHKNLIRCDSELIYLFYLYLFLNIFNGYNEFDFGTK